MINEYQYLAHKTAIYPASYVKDGQTENELGLVYPALGLAGEAGEFCNKVKKIIRDQKGFVTDEIRKDLLGELGDVFWYLAECASALGLVLDDVARNNINKLASRQERGVLTGSGDNR